MDAVWEAYMGFSIAPEPLSPLFQQGGPMEWINEDIAQTLFFMFVLWVVDTLFVKRFLVVKSRYFALHAVANAIIAFAAFPDMKRGLWTEPLNCFNGRSATMVGNSAAAAIHLYHCVAFDLRAEDIFHHLTFTAVLCGLAVPFKQIGGVANNLGCFFLSGLPGGIDYVLLVLVQEGIKDKMFEKKWNTVINVYLRGPSMAIYGFLGMQALVQQSQGSNHWIVIVIVTALHFYNGQHYNQQAVESFATHKERARVQKLLQEEQKGDDHKRNEHHHKTALHPKKE